MITGWLDPVQNLNSDVLTAPLPEPFEVVYSDRVSSRGPRLASADVFGDADVELSEDGAFPVTFYVTLRLNKLYDNVLVDRLE